MRSETLEFLHRLHAFFAHRGEIDKLWRGTASSGRIEGLDIWTGGIENADGFFKPEFLQQRPDGTPVRDLEDVYAAAQHAMPPFTEFLRRIPREVQGIDPAFAHIAPEKKRERAAQKTHDDYGARDPGPGEAWLYDINRASIECEGKETRRTSSGGGTETTGCSFSGAGESAEQEGAEHCRGGRSTVGLKSFPRAALSPCRGSPCGEWGAWAAAKQPSPPDVCPLGRGRRPTHPLFGDSRVRGRAAAVPADCGIRLRRGRPRSRLAWSSEHGVVWNTPGHGVVVSSPAVAFGRKVRGCYGRRWYRRRFAGSVSFQELGGTKTEPSARPRFARCGTRAQRASSLRHSCASSSKARVGNMTSPPA